MALKDQNQPPKRVCIARIAGPHGIKGLIKIKMNGFPPDLLGMGAPVYIDETGDKTIAITLKNPNGKFYLARVENIVDRNQSELLKGTQLYIDESKVPESARDPHDDFIGLKVLDEKGSEIGKIIAVENFGASDLLEIKPKIGESYYIPLVDQYITEINIENGIITVEEIDGLIP